MDAGFDGQKKDPRYPCDFSLSMIRGINMPVMIKTILLYSLLLSSELFISTHGGFQSPFIMSDTS